MKGDVWHQHCKKVYAEAKAQGLKLSWADTLRRASTSYTKKVKPLSRRGGITWVEWIHVHAMLTGLTYGQAMRDPECSLGWKQFKGEVPTSSEMEITITRKEPLVEPVLPKPKANAEVYYKLSTMKQEEVDELKKASTTMHKWVYDGWATKPYTHQRVVVPEAKITIPRFTDCIGVG